MRLPPSVPLTDTSPGVFESSFDYYGSANLFWGKRSRTHNPAFDKAFRIRMDEFLNSSAGDEPTDGQRFGAWLRAAYSSMVDYDGFMDSARKLEPGIMAEVDAAFQSQQGQYIEDLAYQRDRALMVSERASPGWVSGFGRMGAEMAGAILGDADPLMLATFYFGAPYRAAAAAKGTWRGVGAAQSGFQRQFRNIGKRKWRGEGGILRTAGRQAATDMGAVAALSGPAGYLDKLWLESVGVSEELQIAKATERWMEVPFAGLLRGAGSLTIDAGANVLQRFRPRYESRVSWGESTNSDRWRMNPGFGLPEKPPAPANWARPQGPMTRSEVAERLVKDVGGLGQTARREFWGDATEMDDYDLYLLLDGLGEKEFAQIYKKFQAWKKKQLGDVGEPGEPREEFWEGTPAGELQPRDVSTLSFQDKTNAIRKFMPSKDADVESVLTEMKDADPKKFRAAASAVIRAIKKASEKPPPKKEAPEWIPEEPFEWQIESVDYDRGKHGPHRPIFASQSGSGIARMEQRARQRIMGLPALASQGRAGGLSRMEQRADEILRGLPMMLERITAGGWESLKKIHPELWERYYPLWHPQIRKLMPVPGGNQKMAGGGTRREVLEQIRKLGLDGERLADARNTARKRIAEYEELRVKRKERDIIPQIPLARKKAQRAIVRVGREELRLADEIFHKRFVKVGSEWRPRDVLSAAGNPRNGAVEASIPPTKPPEGNTPAKMAEAAAGMDAALTNKPARSVAALKNNGLKNPATGMPQGSKEILESDIGIDAAVYQHRRSVKEGQDGFDGESIDMADKIDNSKIGKILVHELRDGRVIVVNGHQRLNFFRYKRLEEDGENLWLSADVLREEDGWTASMAREYGAWLNLTSGQRRANAPWEAADFLRNKSALGEKLFDESIPPQSLKKDFDDGALLNNFHPAALDESAKGMEQSEYWAAGMAALADAGRRWDESLQVEAIKLFAEKFHQSEVPTKYKRDILNLSRSIAANINADMAKGRAALQAKAQGGLGEILAGGNSAMFDARLKLLSDFLRIAKGTKNAMQALAGKTGSHVGRTVEGKLNRKQAAAKAAEMELDDYFATKAHHADSAEYAMIGEFAERVVSKELTAQQAAEAMLDAWIGRNKKGAVKAEGKQVLEQQDTTAAAAMFESDVSRETPPKQPKKPPETQENTPPPADKPAPSPPPPEGKPAKNSLAESELAEIESSMARLKRNINERQAPHANKPLTDESLRMMDEVAPLKERLAELEKRKKELLNAEKGILPAPAKPKASATPGGEKTLQGLVEQENEVAGSMRQAVYEALGGVGDHAQIKDWRQTNILEDVYRTLRFNGIDSAMREFEGALSKGDFAAEAGERSAKLRPVLENLFGELLDIIRKANKGAEGDARRMDSPSRLLDKRKEKFAKEAGAEIADLFGGKQGGRLQSKINDILLEVERGDIDKAINSVIFRLPRSMKEETKRARAEKIRPVLEEYRRKIDSDENLAAGDVRGDWESSARLAAALARMFGDDAPPLAVLAEVFSSAGNRVGGRVYGGGIELAEHRAGFGLLSHESLHILQQRGVLSDDEMLALSAAGKRLAATDETIRRRLDAVDENGEKIYTGGALEWEYGALFAEHYTRASKAQRARLAGEELSVFARIVEWLEEAADILRSYFGDNTAKARLFMRRLSRGQVDVEGARTALERSQNIIRDKDGNMAVFYHGTPESFGKYRRGRVKVRDLAGDEDQRVDLGVHFGDEATASNNWERKATGVPRAKRNIKQAYLSGKMAMVALDAGDWTNPKTLKASFGASMPPPAAFSDGLGKLGVDELGALELPQDVKERVIAVLDTPQGLNNTSADRVNAVRKILMDAGIDILVYPNLVEGSSRGAPSFIAINRKAILSLDGKPIGESAEKFAAPPPRMGVNGKPLAAWWSGKGDWKQDPRMVGADKSVLDDKGAPKRFYHGGSRIWRVADEFKKERATSGPMAYFSDDPNIASGYAKNKTDMGDEPMVLYGGKDADEKWAEMSAEERAQATEQYNRMDTRENAETGDDELFLGASPDQQKALFLEETDGNALAAAERYFLASGILYPMNREDHAAVWREMAQAMGVRGVEFPHMDAQGVVPVFIGLKNPVETINGKVPPAAVKILRAAAKKEKATPPKGRRDDNWHKDNHSDPQEWLSQLESKRDQTLWTSIPTWASDALKKAGYDGIIDRGGVARDELHSVAIPFESKSIISATTGDTMSDELLSADFDLDAPKRGQLTGGEIEKRENARKREAQKDEEAGLLAQKLAKGGLVSGGQSAAALRQLDMFGDNHKPIPGAEVVQKNGRWLVYHNGEPVAVKRTEAAALKAAQEYAPEKNPLFDIGGNDTYFRAGDLEIRGMDGGGYGVYKAGELEAEYEKMADAALHVERERGGNDGAAAADLFSKCMGGK